MTAKTTQAQAPRQRSKAEKTALRYAAALGVIALVSLMLHSLLLAALGVLGLLTFAVLHARRAHRRWRQGGKSAARRRAKYQGWASHKDILRLRWAHAALTRRVCPGAGLLVLGRARRQAVAVCRENSAMYVGVPGYWKTSALACHAADAPGLLFATSTKTGLLLDTVPYRARAGRRIWVLNADGYGGIPSNLTWSPVEGCEVRQTAMRRAGDLMDAAPHDPSGKDAHWDALSKEMLQYLLKAAALLDGANILTVQEWASNPLTAGKAAEVLGQHDPGWGRGLVSMVTQALNDDKYWSAISSGVGAALAWIKDDAMEAAACPRPGDGFSAREFARSSDSAYLIGRKRPSGSLAPYFAALGAEIFEQIKVYAMEQPSGRPPVMPTYVLDEMPLTCPMPLHDMLAEAREFATFILAVQTLAQLRAKFGKDDGDTIRSTCPVEVFTGGEKRHEDLESVSGVIGNVDTWHGSHDDLRAEPLMPPGALHRLKKGKAVILLPECRPVLASLPAIWKRPGHKRATLGDFPALTPATRRAIEAPRNPIAMPGARPEITVPEWAVFTAPDAVPAITENEEDSWHETSAAAS